MVDKGNCCPWSGNDQSRMAKKEKVVSRKEKSCCSNDEQMHNHFFLLLRQPSVPSFQAHLTTFLLMCWSCSLPSHLQFFGNSPAYRKSQLVTKAKTCQTLGVPLLEFPFPDVFAPSNNNTYKKR